MLEKIKADSSMYHAEVMFRQGGCSILFGSLDVSLRFMEFVNRWIARKQDKYHD